MSALLVRDKFKFESKTMSLVDESSVPNFPISFLDYTAEEVLVTIVPSISHPQFRFTSYNIGPLESGIPVQVPLWFAITLRKRGKCQIQIPSWLNVSFLEKIVKNESSSQQRVLDILPYQYHELSNLFLTYAIEDIEYPERIQALIQDISNIRDDRIRIGLRAIAETVRNGTSIVSANLHNVSSLEIFSIRSFFLGSLDAFLWLKPPDGEGNLFGEMEDMGMVSHSNNRTSNNTASLLTQQINQENNENGPGRKGLRKHRK